MEQSATQNEFVDEKQEILKTLSDIRRTFERRADELIPMLQSAQRALGYLPEEVLLGIAGLAKVPVARVFGVVTFYEQFRLQPVGKHMVRICKGTACHVRGSDRIIKDIQSRLDVAPGETTPDRQFTVETVACFGSCALAPVMVIDDSVKGRIDPPGAQKILEQLQKQAKNDPKDGPTIKK